MARGHRCSALPLARLCPTAPVLSAQNPKGSRRALMGSAWHAHCAGEEQAKELLAKLTPEEREELRGWSKPQPCWIGGFEVTYEQSDTEVRLGLDEYGEHVPYASEEAITCGTADMVCAPEGADFVFIGDMKATHFAEPDGPSSLQVHAYALAAASLYRRDAYVTGIWSNSESTWRLGERVDVMGPEWMDWLEQVKAAALNTGDPVTGDHCSRCYARLHCPAYTLPPEVIGTSIEELRTGAMDAEKGRKLLALVAQAESIAKEAKGFLQAWARENGGIPSEDGERVWAPVIQSGRTSIDTKRLKTDHPKLAEQYSRKGSDFERFQWVKVKR